MVRRKYGGSRRTRMRSMRGGRRTRRPSRKRPSRKMYGGRRTKRMRGGRKTRIPKTSGSFMMHGGERPLSTTGGSTFVRHKSLDNAEVTVTLLPKDSNTPVVSDTISSGSINNIAPFVKGTEIQYEKMKWEVRSGKLHPLTIPGDEFNKEPGKPSKIALLFKESTAIGDELKYEMIYDDKTMEATNRDVLNYVKTLVESDDPKNPPNPDDPNNPPNPGDPNNPPNPGDTNNPL